MKTLTNEEICLLLSAAQCQWVAIGEKLQRKDLGDIEREQLLSVREKLKQILIKMD